jgi:cytochrome c2
MINRIQRFVGPEPGTPVRTSPANLACRVGSVGLACVWLLSSMSGAFAQDVKAGLVATYSDENREVILVVPAPGFRLRSSESIHPQIDQKFAAEWRGVLRISRAGQYRVFAEGATVEVNGRVAAERAQLATGEHPLRIHYERLDGEARLELRWQSEFFREEPVPSEALGHIEAPAQIVAQDSVENGRFLFAELGCANCHAASDWKLQSRRGPDLANAGSRIQAGWIYEWLKNPHQYRKSAVMPVCLDTEQDRADVTAFLMSLKSGQDVGMTALARPEQLETGKVLFEQVGCARCHDKDNSLDAVGSKYVSAAPITDFIANPHAIDPHGRMPQLFQPAEERHLAGAIASFLFQKMNRAERYPNPPPGSSERGAKLFVSTGCASCHAVKSSIVKKEKILAGPAFGQTVGLPLSHYWDFGDNDSSPVLDRVTGGNEKVEGRKAFAKSDGDRGNAFEFDGNSFIELKHFHRPDTMTISVWVNTTKGGSILTWGRAGGSLRGSRELRMNIGQDGRNSLCYGEYNSDGGWKPVVVKPSDVNLVDGKWHHIAVVRRGESIQHFVDGKARGGGKAQKGGGDYTDRLLIGALGLSANPSNRFTGLMDDLSVWEMALSAEQIATLASGGAPLAMARPASRDVKPFDVQSGCLASKVKRALPNYQLGESDRTALRDFLTTVHPENNGEYRSAPLTAHNLRIRQFRCTKCHELNDQNVQTGVAVDEQGRVVRVERPPLLTGVGAKLTHSWLREVLVQKKRNRPWLNLRMPHFGEGVSDLPELITSSAGVSAEDSARPADRGLADAGLEMIGVRRGKVSCITCHDYRGINRRKDGVVPAPDLADAGTTVRREWFDRWMHDPQRLQPGTSMPQLFLDVSSKERELRIAQLWSALYYQKQLPLPKGVLDQQTEGTRILVKDKPVIFRMATVTPVGQIDRAINVGIPGGLNFTFDAVTCQLKYVWKGEFLDAGPAWNGRGGNPVKAGGEKLVAVKNGHTIQVGEVSEKPRFLGYRLEDQMPVFRYSISGAKVEHRIEVSGARVLQSFVVHSPKMDVVYSGDSETLFVSRSGQREDNLVRYSKADEVKFKIEIPFGNTQK